MKSNSYKVPEGYFGELKSSILSSVHTIQAEQLAAEKPTFRVQMRSAAIYAASFAAMVVMAITGYYLTGYQSQEKELAQSFDEMSLVYGMDEYDIVDYTVDQTSADRALLAEASGDYFDAFGYPTADYEF